MVEFVDKTSEKEGTPINREKMMGLQGFIASKIIFNPDGSIVETNSDGHTKTTTFNEDGSITTVFVGENVITKTTKFNSDGSISEVLS